MQSLVFLNRMEEPCQARLAPVDCETTFQRLAKDTPRYDSWVTGEQLRSLRNLSRAPAYELRYCDLDSAVRKLNLLLD